MNGWRMLSCLAQDESGSCHRVELLLHKGSLCSNGRVGLRREVCCGYMLRERAPIGVGSQAKFA